jgi:hypothetical protein
VTHPLRLNYFGVSYAFGFGLRKGCGTRPMEHVRRSVAGLFRYLGSSVEGVRRKHGREGVAGGRPRRFEQPPAFGAAAPLKTRPFNPYLHAACGHQGTPLAK